MKLLMIGDVISQIGCDYLRQRLPGFKREHGVDMVIANGENSAVGNGILPKSADFLFDSGVDVITTGNHVYKRREILDYFEERPALIRPANFRPECAGTGYYLYETVMYRVCVINLLGQSFMEPVGCPYEAVDRILAEVQADVYVVDIHAEATGEKGALGYYLDGRVAAVLGTHTHVQTADERILSQGTAFISDIGMTGPIDSVLGVRPECVIQRMSLHIPTRFETAEGPCMMQGVLLDIDEKTGKCSAIERISC